MALPAIRGAIGRLPWGLVGALALVIAAERMIERHSLLFTRESTACWRYAGTAARTTATKSEILAFGDSLMKFGFQPRVIEARTGRNAFNLAAYGAPPEHGYFTLRRVLEAGGRPTALVVCFQPSPRVGGDLWRQAHEFAEAISAREALDLAWSWRDPPLFARLMVDRTIPSARTRFGIRSRILSSLRREPPDRRLMVHAIFHRNWGRNRGAHLESDTPHAPEGQAAVAQARRLYPSPMEFSRGDSIHDSYIRRFLDLAAARHIPVVWVIPPMLPEIHARHDEIGQTLATTELAERVRCEYANIVVLDGRKAGFDASAFCPDAIHLNRSGAIALSRGIADVLRHTSTPTPAYVALPRFQRGGATQAEMEDFAQSAKKLRSGVSELR